MRILDIYTKYKITPNLQSHMLCVAGLAKIILDNMVSSIEIDSEAVLQACLFHDIAKIISFKSLKDNEAELQKEFIQKYGDNEHLAANRIVSEIPLLEHAQELVRTNNVKPFLDKIRNIMQSNDYEMKILKYTDSRIAPEGLVTLLGRWEDLVKRFPERKNNPENTEAQEIMMTIERQIQYKCKVTISEITQKQIDNQKDFIISLEI